MTQKSKKCRGNLISKQADCSTYIFWKDKCLIGLRLCTKVVNWNDVIDISSRWYWKVLTHTPRQYDNEWILQHFTFDLKNKDLCFIRPLEMELLLRKIDFLGPWLVHPNEDVRNLARKVYKEGLDR